MFRSRQIGSKRLFYNDPRPPAIWRFSQTRRLQISQDVVELVRTRRQIKEAVPCSALFFIEPIQSLAQSAVALKISKLATMIVYRARKGIP